MAKIIIKNFRAIDYAEIEIKPFTVIIGEQASGKSTISKLVYFFETNFYIFNKILLINYFDQFIESNEINLDKIDFHSVKQKVANSYRNEFRLKFNKFFGSTKDESFEIEYFDFEYSFLLKSDNKISVDVEFSENVFEIKRILITGIAFV